MKAWTDKELKRDFEVGREASSFQHTFVKIAGDERVFHALENFRGRFDQTLDSLRDKTVLKFKPSEVLSIEVRDAQKTVTFERRQAPVDVSVSQESKSPPAGREVVWESSEGKADEAKLTQLLTSLSAMKCEGYIYDRKRDDFKDPIYSIKLNGPEVYILSLFAKDDKNKKDYPGVNLAPLRSASLKSAPRKSASRRSAPLKLAPPDSP